MRKFSAFISVLFFSCVVNAFEMDGFHSGMTRSEVTKLMHSGRALERSAKEGDSPVREMQAVS